MNILNKLLAGSASAAMLVGAAAPAMAQTPYGYGQYGSPNNGSVVGSIINNVLGGGRYGTYGQGNDRLAVDQCARAAEAQVSGDNRYGYGQGGYQSQYQGQYGQQTSSYRGAARVVAVTGVERRSTGLRVTGLIDTGRSQGQYNGQYQGQYNGQYQGQYNGQYQGQQGYNDPRYPQQADNQNVDPRYPQQGYNQNVDPRYAQQGYNQNVDPRWGGWTSQGYANAGRYAELRFNCRVDVRGQITRLNVERNMDYRR